MSGELHLQSRLPSRQDFGMINSSSKPDKGPRRDSSKEPFCQKMLAEHAAGGQGIRAFCRQRGLTERSFYACRRAIDQRDRKPAAPPEARQPRFVELCTLQPMRGSDDAPLEIVAGNHRLLIRPGPQAVFQSSRIFIWQRHSNSDFAQEVALL